MLKETGKSIKFEDLTPYSFSKGLYFKTLIDNKKAIPPQPTFS